MMQSGEIRQNKATKQWVIYAPARRKRPRDFQREHPLPKEEPLLFDEHCPFCPGNEHQLGEILDESPSGQDGWGVRVVANKFPALVPDTDLRRAMREIYVVMSGYGHHEVVIETPAHNRQPGNMSVQEVSAFVAAYHRRYVELMRKEENMMILIFRNHGPRAGTSLAHPHSQIIAMGMVPHHVRWREEEAERYFDEWGRCVYCDILEQETRDKTRIVAENPSFVSFVPFAAEVPFETWIIPKQHRADFGDITDAERSDFAAALHCVLSALRRELEDPDYNYIINTSARYRAGEPQLHWYLQIRPRLLTRAGFEIGSGVPINPSIPEEDAAFLRTAISSGG